MLYRQLYLPHLKPYLYEERHDIRFRRTRGCLFRPEFGAVVLILTFLSAAPFLWGTADLGLLGGM